MKQTIILSLFLSLLAVNVVAQEKYAAGKSTVFEYNESKMRLANVLSAQAQAKYTCLLKNRILNFYACQELADTN